MVKTIDMPDFITAYRDGPVVVDVREAAEYVEGHVYADDLRRIARDRAVTDRDVARCEALARLCAAIHTVRQDAPEVYRRAIRDLVGHGEGIFGLVDGYPDGVPMAPPERLFAIEERCLAWRWKLKGRGERLCRTHGDFHPFNVLFGAGTEFRTLDRSRGAWGEPADDVSCTRLLHVEASAAVARAEREGRLTSHQTDAVLALLSR